MRKPGKATLLQISIMPRSLALNPAGGWRRSSPCALDRASRSPARRRPPLPAAAPAPWPTPTRAPPGSARPTRSPSRTP
uniref:Uncharacterized protein n=1 Tax=Arundo donax TaxID=35708 RepID=A0A0A8XZJ8_ARUDO